MENYDSKEINYLGVLTKVEYVVTMFSISTLYTLPQIIHFFPSRFRVCYTYKLQEENICLSGELCTL